MAYEDKDKNKNEDQESAAEAREKAEEAARENDPFNPEKPFENIKSAAAEKAEENIQEAGKTLDENLENFSGAVGGETALVSELEQIKTETAGKIGEVGTEFKTNLETVQEPGEKPAENNDENQEKQQESMEKMKEAALNEIKSVLADSIRLKKEAKKNKDPQKTEGLKAQLEQAKSTLEKSEAAYKELLINELVGEIEKSPETSDLELVEKFLMPGLQKLEEEENAANPKPDHNILKDGLTFIGKHMPKNALLRTATVSALIAVGSIPFMHVAGAGLALAVGAKIARSIAGSVVGERVSHFVGEKMDAANEKKRKKRLSENFDGSLEMLMKLAESEMKIGKKQKVIKNFVKFGTHLVVAGGVMGALELAQMGVEKGVEAAAHSLEQAAGQAAEGVAEKVVETTAETVEHLTGAALIAEVLLVSTKHAAIDKIAEHTAEKTIKAHEKKQQTAERMAA
jgi:hypothetical protein